MKFLILDTYYPAAIRSFYRANARVRHLPYLEQKAALMGMSFGTADFYSSNLRRLGHEAEEVVVNCRPLQMAWVREEWSGPRPRGLGKYWEMTVVMEMAARSKPDVLYVQDVTYFDASFLDALREHVQFVVGQTAYAVDWSYSFSAYDLTLTSFPHFVDRFRSLGVSSEYLQIAFEPRVLEKLEDVDRDIPVSFVGLYSSSHRAGQQVLEAVARELPLAWWGHIEESLPRRLALRRAYRGEAWGLDMYRILRRSRVTLNRHAGAAENFANNMRLYEATGVGACLVTDTKDNLHELFRVDEEVVTYRSAKECAEKVTYLLNHEKERALIASAGQMRTMREHTYFHRMQELEEILDPYLHRPRGGPSQTFGARATRLQRAGTTIASLTRAGVRASPLAPLARQVLRAFRQLRPRTSEISAAYEVISRDQADEHLTKGWQNINIPHQQRRLVGKELSRMYRGQVVPVYKVAADAVRATGLENPLIIEVGCASGYYSEVLSHLLGGPLRYIGIDYSSSMLAQARRYYPAVPFLVGDATALPLRDACCDILFSPAVIMHVPEYKEAISECARVTRAFCIFHRTPVTREETTFLTKRAYGVPVVELVFAESELLEMLEHVGLTLQKEFLLDHTRVPGVERAVAVKTYLCRKL